MILSHRQFLNASWVALVLMSVFGMILSSTYSIQWLYNLSFVLANAALAFYVIVASIIFMLLSAFVFNAELAEDRTKVHVGIKVYREIMARELGWWTPYKGFGILNKIIQIFMAFIFAVDGYLVQASILASILVAEHFGWWMLLTWAYIYINRVDFFCTDKMGITLQQLALERMIGGKPEAKKEDLEEKIGGEWDFLENDDEESIDLTDLKRKLGEDEDDDEEEGDIVEKDG